MLSCWVLGTTVRVATRTAGSSMDRSRVKHHLGRLLGVHHWPSRRYMARLRNENQQLHRHDDSMRDFVVTAVASARTVQVSAERLRKKL